MVKAGKILLVCLVLGSGCKIISSSFRGKNKGEQEASTGSGPSTSADGTLEQPPVQQNHSEEPNIPQPDSRQPTSQQPPTQKTNEPQPGPTVPEDSFNIPDPASDSPLEGNVTQRSGGGIEISGAVSGVWDKKLQPVHVMGDITIKAGRTLLIKEGVQVLVAPTARFLIEGGQLKIAGTAAEQVLFTSLSPEQTWQGIRVCSAPGCDSEVVKGRIEIRHAVFEKSRKTDSNPNDVTWRRGGVLNMRMTETILIEDSTFQNNFALERGGAIELITDNPNVIFRRNVLRDNASDGGGGALQITHGRYLKLEQNTFVNNTTRTEGAAIAFIDSAAILLLNNVFDSNRAEQPGGAVACDGHGLTINIDSSNTFKNNLPNDKLCKDE